MSAIQSDRLRWKLTIASFLFLLLFITAHQAISQPCAVSPSAGGVTVLPNVLVIFDNSGSMLEDAHLGNYNRTTTYEGMFDHAKRYSYNTTNGYFYENDPGGAWSGNFLNWISMTKVDLARQVLTGGKVYNDGTNNYLASNITVRPKAISAFNDSTSPYQTAHHGTYYYLHVSMTSGEWSRFRVYTDSGGTTLQAAYNIKLLLPVGYTPQGLLHTIQGKVRLGLMHFNDNQGGYIRRYIKKLDSTQLNNIVSDLNRDLDADYPSTWTPLAETLYEATRFFSQLSSYSAYGGANYTPNPGGVNDPLYNEDYGAVIRCAKNYVILLTDGNSTQDQEIPTELQDYYDDELGCTPDPNPCGCDPDYTCSGGGFSDNGSAYLDDIAYYAHTTDLRPSDGGVRALEDDQTITLHNVYLFGVVGEADVLLRKAAQRGGGQYYRAESASAIAAALEDIFLVITEKAAAAASTAITSEPVSGIDMIYVPYYKNPQEDQWLGNIKAFRLGSNGYLLAGDTGATPATDSDGDLVLDDPKWEASAKIKEKADANSRTIFTYISGGKVDFDISHANTVGKYFDVDLNNNSTEDEADEANALISYVRGNDNPTGFSDLRERDPYYLGDIMHASPVFVGKPSARYDLMYGDISYWQFYWANKDRTPVLYAPANDGMLHCFDADDGEEHWAYIPYNLLPHLKWLADPNYCHCYYVDLTANVWDIKLSSGWKSVLVGGMRIGGTPDGVDTTVPSDGTTDETLKSALFALDVTNPNNPQVLWEINDDTNARFGYTTSKPIPVRVEDGGTTKWFLVFGSGPKTRDGTGLNTDGYSVTDGYIFVLDLATGGITQIDVGAAWRGGNFFGPPVAIDYDLDYNVDLIYIGDAKGNLWRIKTFTVSGEGVKTYYTDPGDWSIDVNSDDEANPEPLLSLGTDQPILIKPAISKDDKGRVWIFFGTGRYFCADDNEYCGNGNTCPASGSCIESESVGDRSKYMAVGVYDRHWYNDTVNPANSGFVLQSSTLGKGNLDHRVIKEGEVVGNGEAGYYVVDSVTGEIATDVSTNGWYYHLLENRERCLGDFLIYQGAVFFLSFTPDVSDPCVRGGLSNLYGVYYTSGTSTASPILDLTDEGTVDTGDLVEGSDYKRRGAVLKKLGKGFAGGGLKIKRFEVTGGGYVDKGYPPLPENPPLTLVPPGDDTSTGVTSWREVLP
jgi:type IV pilus assembly protein PilY1